MPKQHGNSKYTKKLADKICVLVSDGSNLEQIGADKAFPCKQTIRGWFKDHPEFFTEYTRAREERADWRSNRMDTTCQELRDGDIDYQTARILLDNDKWQAGKENPKLYGDKQIHTGSDGDGPIDTSLTITYVDAKKSG